MDKFDRQRGGQQVERVGLNALFVLHGYEVEPALRAG
jgi:hypothetical protein